MSQQEDSQSQSQSQSQSRSQSHSQDQRLHTQRSDHVYAVGGSNSSSLLDTFLQDEDAADLLHAIRSWNLQKKQDAPHPSLTTVLVPSDPTPFHPKSTHVNIHVNMNRNMNKSHSPSLLQEESEIQAISTVTSQDFSTATSFTNDTTLLTMTTTLSPTADTNPTYHPTHNNNNDYNNNNYNNNHKNQKHNRRNSTDTWVMTPSGSKSVVSTGTTPSYRGNYSSKPSSLTTRILYSTSSMEDSQQQRQQQQQQQQEEEEQEEEQQQLLLQDHVVPPLATVNVHTTMKTPLKRTVANRKLSSHLYYSQIENPHDENENENVEEEDVQEEQSQYSHTYPYRPTTFSNVQKKKMNTTTVLEPKGKSHGNTTQALTWLQDTAQVLGFSRQDVHLVLPTVQTLVQVIQNHLPPLEQFVQDVCHMVLQEKYEEEEDDDEDEEEEGEMEYHLDRDDEDVEYDHEQEQESRKETTHVHRHNYTNNTKQNHPNDHDGSHDINRCIFRDTNRDTNGTRNRWKPSIQIQQQQQHSSRKKDIQQETMNLALNQLRMNWKHDNRSHSKEKNISMGNKCPTVDTKNGNSAASSKDRRLDIDPTPDRIQIHTTMNHFRQAIVDILMVREQYQHEVYCQDENNMATPHFKTEFSDEEILQAFQDLIEREERYNCIELAFQINPSMLEKDRIVETTKVDSSTGQENETNHNSNNSLTSKKHQKGWNVNTLQEFFQLDAATLRRYVLHFSHLFSVTKHVDIIPFMNGLFIFFQESNILVRTLQKSLKLPQSCPLSTITRQIIDVL